MTAWSKMPTTSQAIGLLTLPCRRTKSGHSIPSRSSIRITKPRIPMLDCRRTLTAHTRIIQSCISTRCGSRRGCSTILNTGSLVTRIQSGAQWPVVEGMALRWANPSCRRLQKWMAYGDPSLRTRTNLGSCHQGPNQVYIRDDSGTIVRFWLSEKIFHCTQYGCFTYVPALQVAHLFHRGR